MVSKPKPGGGAPQQQASPTAPQGPPGAPLAPGMAPQPPAGPGIDKGQLLQMILANAQPTSMGYNPTRGGFGVGGNNR